MISSTLPSLFDPPQSRRSEAALIVLMVDPSIGCVEVRLPEPLFEPVFGRMGLLLPESERIGFLPSSLRPSDIIPRDDALFFQIASGGSASSLLARSAFLVTPDIDRARRDTIALLLDARSTGGGAVESLRPAFTGALILNVSTDSPSPASPLGVRIAPDQERPPTGLRLPERARKSAFSSDDLLQARKRLSHVGVPESLLRLAFERKEIHAFGPGNTDGLGLLRIVRALAALSGRSEAGSDDLDAAFWLVGEAASSPAPEKTAEKAPRDERRAGSPDGAPMERRGAASAPDRPAAPPEKVAAPSIPIGTWLRGLHAPGKGKSALVETHRGRTVRHRRFRGPGDRISPLATFRHAAPAQRARGWSPGEPLRLERSDLETAVRESKVGTLFLIVIDASGSMARARIRWAKGAALSLLAKAYVHRDRVAVIAFNGRSARLILAPGQSLSRGEAALRHLPLGGTTPLSAALSLAHDVARRSSREGPAQCLVFTDGKANVAVNEGRDPLSEAASVAEALKRRGVKLVILSSGEAGGEAAALATRLRADHLQLLPPTR